MAHHNNTPESVLNAPKKSTGVVAAHVSASDPSGQHRTMKHYSDTGDIDPVTGVYTNPEKRRLKEERKARKRR